MRKDEKNKTMISELAEKALNISKQLYKISDRIKIRRNKSVPIEEIKEYIRMCNDLVKSSKAQVHTTKPGGEEKSSTNNKTVIPGEYLKHVMANKESLSFFTKNKEKHDRVNGVLKRKVECFDQFKSMVDKML